jgi:hypothetical protein
LDSLKYPPEGRHTEAVRALRSHPTRGRYLKRDDKGRLFIDRAKVNTEERLDGKYLLRTSDDSIHAADLVTPDGHVTQRTETTSDQRGLFTALGIHEPPHILNVQTSRHRAS